SHCRDVVAAVTNAGGFGVLGATGHSPHALEIDLAWIDEQVKNKPYGVDLLLPVNYDKTAPQRGAPEQPQAAEPAGPLFPAGYQAFLDDLLTRYGVPELPGHLPASAGALSVSPQAASNLLDVAFGHPIRLVASALGPPPADLVRQAHDRGVVVAALVGTAEHARRQQAAGVDLIVAQGTEAGPHRPDLHHGARPRGGQDGRAGAGAGRGRHRDRHPDGGGDGARGPGRVVRLGLAHH